MIQQKIKLIRNHEPIPYVFDEGSFDKPLPCPPKPAINDKHKNWSHGLFPHDRLFYHQTLTSARRSANFKEFIDIPKDSLDFTLAGQYNHDKELFVNKSDVVLQSETLSIPGDNNQRIFFRRLRNSQDVKLQCAHKLHHPLAIGMFYFNQNNMHLSILKVKPRIFTIDSFKN